MKKILLSLLFVGIICGNALAQEDVTPPVLLDFTISPVVFDASLSDVNIEACVTGADDLSGLNWAAVGLTKDGWSFETVIGNFPTGEDTVCISLQVPQFFPFGVISVKVVLTDNIPNGREIEAAELCSAGFTCELLNRASTSLPDSDSDGVPDDADNCPEDFNPNQEDRDLDLIGDICDPFPDDRDNEQAQCEADLAACLENPIFLDADGDGESDSTDRCPGTSSGDDVDGDGCSPSQYCSAIDASTPEGRKVCERSDWKNDEPMETKGDCKAIKEGESSSNYLCVPR